MPNRCTKCGRVYEGPEAVVKGCECGNRLFIYIRRISDAEAERLKASKEAREVKARLDEDIWNIKVEEGVYDLDLASLMAKEPIIVAGEEGRYLLSLSSAFKRGKKR